MLLAVGDNLVTILLGARVKPEVHQYLFKVLRLAQSWRNSTSANTLHSQLVRVGITFLKLRQNLLIKDRLVNGSLRKDTTENVWL